MLAFFVLQRQVQMLLTVVAFWCRCSDTCFPGPMWPVVAAAVLLQVALQWQLPSAASRAALQGLLP